MRIPSLLSALTLAVLCSVPTAAQEQAQAPSQESAQKPASAVQAAPAAQPTAGQDLFLPEPEDKYGIIFPGPCTVSVPCGDGSTVKCSGQTRCTWYYGNPGAPFVECDGVRKTCPLN